MSQSTRAAVVHQLTAFVKATPDWHQETHLPRLFQIWQSMNDAGLSYDEMRQEDAQYTEAEGERFFKIRDVLWAWDRYAQLQKV